MSKSAQRQSPSARDKDKENGSATGAAGAGIHGVDLNNLKQELFLKIVVLGDLGVGKTSLVRTYTESGVVGGPGSAGSGSESGGGYKVSFDAGYHLKRLEVGEKLVNIQLWDIPGHERFGGLTRVHYKYAHGALIVFDLSRPEETFDTALSWLSDVTQKLFDETPNEEEVVDDDAAIENANRAMPIVLLANKCDLPELKVARQKYNSYVKDNGLLAWFETSSRDFGNISLAVQRLVEYILETDDSVRAAGENAQIWKQF